MTKLKRKQTVAINPSSSGTYAVLCSLHKYFINVTLSTDVLRVFDFCVRCSILERRFVPLES